MALTDHRLTAWDSLNRQIIRCDRCARLRAYCDEVARQKRREFQEWSYWGRPVPNFGDPVAGLLIVGLAPAAHGANRTGRMFTGDRSGQWLYRALHRAGLASHPAALSADDGLQLRGCAITAVCHCAPPDNRPTREELAHCGIWLAATLDLLPVRVILALGGIAWNATVDELRTRGWWRGARPRFAHGTNVDLPDGRQLLGSYHPSQQNTFTKRLTETMLDEVVGRAKQLAEQ